MLTKEGSFILYLLIFGLPPLMMLKAQKNDLAGRYTRYGNKMILLIALAIPVFFTGFRACGTDIYTYAAQYMRALQTPVKWFWQEGGEFEVVFILVSKLARQLGSIRILFTICAIITAAPVYKAIWDQRSTMVVSYALMCFLFLFFPTSWNIVRQYMAVGVAAFSYKYVFERKPVRFFICVFLAMLCHTTAIAMAPIYFLWSNKDDLITDIRMWIAIISLLVFVVGMQQIFGGKMGGVFESYSSYLSTDKESGNRDFYLNIAVLAVMFLCRKRLFALDKRNKFFILMLLFQCIIGITGFRTPYIKRIGLYFGITQMFLFGALPLAFKDSRNGIFIKLGLIFFAVGQFWFVDYYLNQPKIVPYSWEFPRWLSE